MLIYLKVFLTICLWGVSFAVTKTALIEMPPEVLILFRCSLGFLTLVFFQPKLKWLKNLKTTLWIKLIFISFLGLAGHKTLQAYAMKYTSANHAGWLIGAIPLIVALIMAIFFSERFSKLRSLGFLLGFIGVMVVVISRQTDLKGVLIPTGKGDLLFMVSCFTWAFYTVLTKRWFGKFKMLEITFITMFIASLIMTATSLATCDLSGIKFITPKGWLSVLYLGIFCSGVAYAFWNDGVEKLGASSVSSFLYLEPFPAIVGGFIMLGEKISPLAFLGGISILIGVYLVNSKRLDIKTIGKIIGKTKIIFFSPENEVTKKSMPEEQKPSE